MNGSILQWHASCHTTTIHTWFRDFIGPKYRSRSCDNTCTVIYISAKKKVFTINYFLEHEWWYLYPLAAVAYVSVTTFICDDYTTCLKIINCITQVMIILGPCRNNWVTNFRQEWPNLLFLCVHILCTNAKLHTAPQKQNNKSDWRWQRWHCNWVATSWVVTQVTGF